MIVSFDRCHKLLAFWTETTIHTILYCWHSDWSCQITKRSFWNQRCGIVLSETQHIDAYVDDRMDRNERRTCWLRGWIRLDVFLSRLSSMEVAWFLITSDLSVSVFTWVQGQRRSLDLHMTNLAYTRRRTTLLIVGTPEWLSWLFLVFF